tara:strand:+ start:794 stop:961 length:168 start_codon:yes stop_codon:yes gene_type:complete
MTVYLNLTEDILSFPKVRKIYGLAPLLLIMSFMGVLNLFVEGSISSQFIHYIFLT